MRLRTTITLLLVLAAGCGSEDENGSPIPAEAASSLQRQLDSIEDRFQVGGGACGDITGGLDPNLPAVQSALDSIPPDVDVDVRQALRDGFDRLFTLTGEQCDETKGQETEPDPEPPPPETETETQTETVPEPEPEPDPTTPELPEEPPVDPIPPEGAPSGEEGSGGALTPEGDG